MDSMDEPRSPSLPKSPAASIIVFPLPSTLSSSSFSGQYGVQRNRGQLNNNNNEKVGDIREVLLSRDGKAEAVVIGAGGFLGIGEHDVAVPFSEVKFVDQPRTTNTSDNRPAGASTTTANRSATDGRPSGADAAPTPAGPVPTTGAPTAGSTTGANTNTTSNASGTAASNDNANRTANTTGSTTGSA